MNSDDERAREYQMYCDRIRRTAKSASIDLEAKKHLLEETISSWRIYHELYDSLADWLSKGEHMLGQTSEEKNVKICAEVDLYFPSFVFRTISLILTIGHKFTKKCMLLLID